MFPSSKHEQRRFSSAALRVEKTEVRTARINGFDGPQLPSTNDCLVFGDDTHIDPRRPTTLTLYKKILTRSDHRWQFPRGKKSRNPP